MEVIWFGKMMVSPVTALFNPHNQEISLMSTASSEDEFKTIDRFLAELSEIRKRIAELKASEAANRMMVETLQASERLMREVFENLPQRIFVKNNNLAYVFCNDSFARDLNIKKEEVAGKIDYDFYPEDLASKYIADEERILSTGKAEEMEDRYVASGQELTIRAVKTPLKDEKGEPAGVLGVFWDVTERKRLEEESERQRAHLAELVSEHTARIQSLSDELQKALSERQVIEEESQKSRSLLESQVSERDTELQRLSSELERNSGELRRLQDELQQAGATYENQLAERARELEKTKADLESETADRKRAEEDLQKVREMLESKLSERSAELERVTTELQRETAERLRVAEESGQIRATLAAQLEERTCELEKVNAELKNERSERKRIEEDVQRERVSLQEQLSLRSAEVEKLNGELLREINERKQAVENLQHTLNQFRAIMDSMQQIQVKLGNEQPLPEGTQTGS